MNNKPNPAAGQAVNLPPENSGNPIKPTPSPDMSGQVLVNVSRLLGTLWGNPAPQPVKRKRSGKSATRPGFAFKESLLWLAGAAVFWTVFGASIFGFLLFASR